MEIITCRGHVISKSYDHGIIPPQLDINDQNSVFTFEF